MQQRQPPAPALAADSGVMPLPQGRLVFEQVAAALLADGLVAPPDHPRIHQTPRARAIPATCIRSCCWPTSSWRPPIRSAAN